MEREAEEFPKRKRLRRHATLEAAASVPTKRRVRFSDVLVFVPDLPACDRGEEGSPCTPKKPPIPLPPAIPIPTTTPSTPARVFRPVALPSNPPPLAEPHNLELYVPDLNALRKRLDTTRDFLRTAVDAGLIDKGTAELKQAEFKKVVKEELLIQLEGLGILWRRRQRLEVAKSRIVAQGLEEVASGGIRQMNEEDTADILAWARRA